MKRWSKRSPAVLCLWLLLLVLAACRQAGLPEQQQGWLAAPDRQFDRLFQRSNGGWTGGDGTLSVALPDGRTVWLFGDTFLGRVSPEGRRPQDTPFIRNSLVVQEGGALGTLFRSDAAEPSAFFNPPQPDQWYWPGHGMVEGDRVKIFLHRFEQTEPRLWSFRWTGTELATLSLPALALTGIEATPPSPGVLYGVCLLRIEAHIYIFGTADRLNPKQAHVARAPAGQLSGPWQYFSGAAWADRPEGSVAILAGVSTQYAVLAYAQHVYLFTMDGRQPLSDLIVAYRAERPTGPWQGPVSVYRAPGTDRQVVAYNPFVHPQFSRRGQVLVSYNLNHISDPGALYLDAAIYRPRFIRVDMQELARRFEPDR